MRATELGTTSLFDVFAGQGSEVAVIADGIELSYGELEDRVRARADELGSGRRLLLIQSSNELEPLITYLAAMRSRHPVMLVPADKPTDDVVATYRPDMVFAPSPRFADSSEDSPGAWELSHLRDESIHDLHPDLALLLSTSGSTGTSKFVRLSHQNLVANADSISEYLQIRSSDRAATSLPLHYCYGLSIVNSHLRSGAALILTSNSVVDPCFWTEFQRHEGTTFPGVPFTFDLLDRINFESVDVPSLRYITQAGGRLDPEMVRRYAELGKVKGFDLFVMYGATEATARMAYLPPDLAAENSAAIGQPIPGGSFDLSDDGEIVYSGPNVMMGYAEGPSDLARGDETPVLHTGDLGRVNEAGLYEIVGRKSRFLKLFGLRISLDAVEQFTKERGQPAVATGTDDLLVLATEDRRAASALVEAASEHLGLPRSAISVETYEELPRLTSGKVDYLSIRDAALARRPAPGRDSDEISDGLTVSDLFGQILGRDNVESSDTFVSLGGDSLSYIEASLALEEKLGSVPTDWHLTPVADLDAVVPSSSRFRDVETNVVIRAVAIILILAQHFELFSVLGGAHVLLAVAGFNFSRFLLNNVSQTESVAPVGAAITRIMIPTLAWIALVFGLKRSFDPSVMFLVSSYNADADGGYWFVEVLIQILFVVALALAVPRVRALHRTSPYHFAVGMLAVALAARYGINELWDTTDLGFKVLHMSLWFFVIGWVADQSKVVWQKVALTLVTLLTVPGFFDSDQRTVVIALGIIVLIWLPKVPLPSPLTRVVGAIGTASLYLYLVHFQVRTVLSIEQPFVALIVAVGFGLLAAAVGERVMRHGERRLRSRRAPAIVR